MLFASTSDVAIKAESIERAQRSDQARRSRFARRHMLLCGDSVEAVRAEVRRMFRNAENAAKVSILADTSASPFRYIVDEIARYPGARRGFYDEAGVLDPEYVRIARDDVSFDLLMQEVTTSLFAMNDCVLHVLPGRVDADRAAEGEDHVVESPMVRIFRPHELTVIPAHDDPTEIVAVLYDVLDATGGRCVVVWTRSLHYMLKGGRMMVVPGMDDVVNPYGILPFAGLHNGLRADSFWDDVTGEDLVNADVGYKAGWSALKHARHYSGFPQPVISGIREGDKFEPPTTLDPASLWQLPDGATATTLSLNADLTAQSNTLKIEMGQTVAMYGLLVEDVLGNAGQAPPSGLARYVKRQPLVERRDRMRPFLEEAEHELARLFRWAWNWNHDAKISEAAQFRVEFLPEAPVLSPIEAEELRSKKIARYQAEISLGLRTLDEVMAEDRAVTVDEARAIVAARDTGNGGSLNGAQVTSLQGIVIASSSGQISVESAVALITASFPITEETARRIVGAPMPAVAPVGS